MRGPQAPSLLDAECEGTLAESGADADHSRFVEHLFARYRRPLLRYVSALLGRRAEAEDVLQEAYARLLGVQTLDRTPARARAYLFKTATNLVRDRFRRADAFAVEAPSDDLAEDAETPERIVDFEQGLDAVRRALLELKPRCREVFLMRAVDGLGYDAIATRLGISRRTVEREMKHALDVCQQRLKRAWT
ncbi:MAG TPA: sigma-70 family RNA polymerase sigma factor [Gammaproteobacteria bacterium]